MRMKILMFGWELPPHNNGGLGTACLGLTKSLSSLGIEVIFVLPKKFDANSSHMKIVTADIDHLKVRQVDSLLHPYIGSSGYSSLRDISTDKIYGSNLFDEVRRYALLGGDIAKQEIFDVIHAHDWLSFGAGIEARRVSGKPLILHVHATSFDMSAGGAPDERVYKIERNAFEQADAIIAVSQFTKDILVNRYGISSNMISVVHNGVQAEEFSSGHQTQNRFLQLKEQGYKIVLFVGRITMQKGPDYFLKAAKKVLDYNQKVYFIIAGSGDMENQIIDLSASLGISDHVLFAGFIRGQELLDLYRLADLYVMPSVSEPFGITPLEAVASGTPVLISKQSGVSEVLTHALKADFWDIDDIADKILSVVSNDALGRVLKQNASSQLISINWDGAAEKCNALYIKVLKWFRINKTNHS
jgi:glycogen(starch) synthase